MNNLIQQKYRQKKIVINYRNLNKIKLNQINKKIKKD